MDVETPVIALRLPDDSHRVITSLSPKTVIESVRQKGRETTYRPKEEKLREDTSFQSRMENTVVRGTRRQHVGL